MRTAWARTKRRLARLAGRGRNLRPHDVSSQRARLIHRQHRAPGVDLDSLFFFDRSVGVILSRPRRPPNRRRRALFLAGGEG
jgi:hypothetical protein